MSLRCLSSVGNWYRPKRKPNNMENKNTKQNSLSEKVNNADNDQRMKNGDEKPAGKSVKIKPWIFLLVGNILMLGVMIFFIVDLPKKALELKNARNDEQKVVESKKVDVTGLEYQPTKESVDKLISFYPEEEGVIEFIKRMEKLQTEGVIRNFSLVSENAVKDRTGTYGIPFIAEFGGTWEDIGLSLTKFQQLPFMIRAINIEAKMLGSETADLKFGGFLYVSEKLAKNR